MNGNEVREHETRRNEKSEFGVILKTTSIMCETQSGEGNIDGKRDKYYSKLQLKRMN